ncbi:MAG: HAD-IIB family hydrolase [Bacillales bacterium]
MIKYIATDLDGTLFYPKDRKNMITKENLFFIQSFIDDGGKLILVSGRSLSFGKKVCKKINRECGIIGYNGSIIYDDNKYYNNIYIEKDEISKILSDIEKNIKIPVCTLFTEKGIHVKINKFPLIYKLLYKLLNKAYRVYTEDIIFHKKYFDYASFDENVYKIMLFFGISNLKKNKAMKINKLLREIYPDFEFSWSDQCIEITKKGCSKGEAILKYCKINNINPNEIAVVGDSGNDISMFKNFPTYSFCMNHSHKIIQKYAKYSIDKICDIRNYLKK